MPETQAFGKHQKNGMSSFLDSSLDITECTDELYPMWDTYIEKHENSTHCHLSAWRNIFRRTYGHRAYYLLGQSAGKVVGVLPLFHIRGLTGKGSLVSMPFLDTGGILADSPEVEKALLLKAVLIANRLKVDNIELRNTILPQWAITINREDMLESEVFLDTMHNIHYSLRQFKTRMLMSLPLDPEALMASFKSKLRSQIRRSLKDGCELISGGRELIDQFYKVFAVNMRDLGSPVHSRKLFANILELLPDNARIFLVRKGEIPIAACLTVGFRDVLSNPWASSLREYSHMSPNMLLYAKMLEYGCQKGFAYFDFGRASLNEGTYKFKEQWGAQPQKLYWSYMSLNRTMNLNMGYERSPFEKRAIAYWKRLPVPLTKIIGPAIRKHIAL